MVYHDTAIFALMDRMNVRHIKELGKQPGVQAIHRITAYYIDGRAQHSVATLYCANHAASHRLEVVYDGFLDHHPLIRSIAAENYDAFTTALHKARFDDLSDQSAFTKTVWSIERSSGTFYRRVVLSPHSSDKPYCQITNAVDFYIPEAVREIAT